VRYLLEGSVRKSSDRMRITAQLIEAATGFHVWAHRCDGKLVDVFDLQDELASSVIAAIVPKLEQAEVRRAMRKLTASLDAYDYYLRGVASFYQLTKEAVSEALQQFCKAIELDADFASAYGMAAWCYSQRRRSRWAADPSAERAEARRLALKAAELGKDDALALCLAGNTLSWVSHELDTGAALVDRALELNPNLAIAWRHKAWGRVWLGEPEPAVEAALRGMRLSPVDPLLHDMETALAHAHFIAGRYEMAVSWAEKAWRQEGALFSTPRILAASYVFVGRLGDARSAMSRMLELSPGMCISDVKDRSPFRRPDDLKRYSEGLRLAGLPD
jgi:adenylate cyclase